MSSEATMLERGCQSKCELCGSDSSTAYRSAATQPRNSGSRHHGMYKCLGEIDDPKDSQPLARFKRQHVESRGASSSNCAASTYSSELWKLGSRRQDMMCPEEETRQFGHKSVRLLDDKPLGREWRWTVERWRRNSNQRLTNQNNQVIKQGTVIRGISVGDDPRSLFRQTNGGQSPYVIVEFCRKK